MSQQSFPKKLFTRNLSVGYVHSLPQYTYNLLSQNAPILWFKYSGHRNETLRSFSFYLTIYLPIYYFIYIFWQFVTSTVNIYTNDTLRKSQRQTFESIIFTTPFFFEVLSSHEPQRLLVVPPSYWVTYMFLSDLLLQSLLSSYCTSDVFPVNLVVGYRV